MALSGDDKARLIRSGKLAHLALAPTRMRSRKSLHPGEEAAASGASENDLSMSEAATSAAAVANESERVTRSAIWHSILCNRAMDDDALLGIAHAHHGSHLPSLMERGVR